MGRNERYLKNNIILNIKNTTRASTSPTKIYNNSNTISVSYSINNNNIIISFSNKNNRIISVSNKTSISSTLTTITTPSKSTTASVAATNVSSTPAFCFSFRFRWPRLVSALETKFDLKIVSPHGKIYSNIIIWLCYALCISEFKIIAIAPILLLEVSYYTKIKFTVKIVAQIK